MQYIIQASIESLLSNVVLRVRTRAFTIPTIVIINEPKHTVPKWYRMRLKALVLMGDSNSFLFLK